MHVYTINSLFINITKPLMLYDALKVNILYPVNIEHISWL